LVFRGFSRWYQGGGHDISSPVAVGFLIVEKNVRPECFQDICLGNSTHEKRFVNADVPLFQRPNYTFMSGHTASGNQRDADWGFAAVVCFIGLKQGEYFK
jgi:hypothetical protein